MNHILKLCGGSDNPDIPSCNEVYMYLYVSSHIYSPSSKLYTFTFFLLISKLNKTYTPLYSIVFISFY